MTRRTLHRRSERPTRYPPPALTTPFPPRRVSGAFKDRSLHPHTRVEPVPVRRSRSHRQEGVRTDRRETSHEVPTGVAEDLNLQEVDEVPLYPRGRPAVRKDTRGLRPHEAVAFATSALLPLTGGRGRGRRHGVRRDTTDESHMYTRKDVTSTYSFSHSL